MILHSSEKSDNAYFLEQLGVKWYLNFSPDTSQVPDGAHKVPFIAQRLNPSSLLSTTTIAAMVQSAPAGSYWYVGGEPNDPPKFVSGADFADIFHYYYTEIKKGDPEPNVMSPSMLNWWFTCFNCVGFQRGDQWAAEFISTYRTNYGVKPPVAAWSIDLYPLDWRGWVLRNQGFDPGSFLPNDDWELMRDQITGGTWEIVPVSVGGGRTVFGGGGSTTYQGMRGYLDSQGYEDTPIWITEMAVHWGYDDIDTKVSPPGPLGNYRWDSLSIFLNDLVGWLQANSSTYKIDKWFLFRSWKNISEPASDAYAGIILFGSNDAIGRPQAGVTPLNCLGEVYRALSLGESQVTCDASGEKVP